MQILSPNQVPDKLALTACVSSCVSVLCIQFIKKTTQQTVTDSPQHNKFNSNRGFSCDDGCNYQTNNLVVFIFNSTPLLSPPVFVWLQLMSTSIQTNVRQMFHGACVNTNAQRLGVSTQVKRFSDSILSEDIIALFQTLITSARQDVLVPSKVSSIFRRVCKIAKSEY